MIFKITLISLCFLANASSKGKSSLRAKLGQTIDDLATMATAAINATMTAEASGGTTATAANTTAATATTSTANTTATTSNTTTPYSGKVTNALGQVKAANMTLTSLPTKVTSCGQVLQIDVTRILDMEDYGKRDTGYLTMNAYIINLFTSSSSGILIESMTMDNMNRPSAIQGALNCTEFSAKGGKRVGICFDDEKKASSVLKAYQSFMNCRMGDNLSTLTLEQMRAIFEFGMWK
jgi:hypothetical protein